jgi:hypothetical protein
MPRTAIQPTAAEQLARLRRRAAATDNAGTLAQIGRDAEELRWVAAESLYVEIDAFVARLQDKIERLPGAASKPKRQAAAVHITDRNGAMSPSIRMIVSPWTIDAEGVRGRVLYRADDVPPP